MKKFTALALLITLGACQGATTAAPIGSQDEILAERNAEAQMAKQASASKSTGQKVAITSDMQSRYKRVAEKVASAGQAMCKDMGTSCNFGFKIEESADLNAYADGKDIVISSAMIDFATETELANVVAHEYAHNVMGHVASQTQNAAVGGILGMIVDQVAASQGVQTGGAASKLGSNYSTMRYSVGFEQEADYVGLYIMQRAGYDINAAPNFWRKMSAADERGISIRTTHPTNPERYVALNHTIKEIEAKKAAGQPLVPNIRKK